ncbi:MAG: NAD-dependent epimerase/dehydratase family protein [Planctomycetota bacterium]|nr:NAD-dependent epimerase/dehydratase family protein [Planctomycetota bacterium]
MQLRSRMIFGCGYLGHRVAQRWRHRGDVVYAVTRSEARADQLSDEGLQPIVADVTRPGTLSGLPGCHTVLFAVGFDRTTGDAIRDVYVEGLRHVLDALPGGTGHFIYISSTGVYGQNDGSWVDEASPCQPQREGGRACLEAEQLLGQHPRGGSATILRLAGIYGPGRVPRLQDLRDERPIASPAEGYLNLIHVDDAVTAVDAAAERGAPLDVVNVSDGRPVIRREYFGHIAARLGLAPPQLVDPPAGSGRQQRGSSSKRIRNKRMLQELGVELRFPSYREGLAAALT